MTPRGAKRARQRTHRLGVIAEYAAMFWLSLKGYRVLALRYKTPVGEIDLVMRRGKILIMVEVKARANHAVAAQAIHHKNQSRVMRAAQYFIVHHPAYQDYQVRFDAVLIAWYRWPRHLPHAFVSLV